VSRVSQRFRYFEILWIVLVLALILLPGCISGQARLACKENAILARHMSELVKKGETTREQEQEFIHVNAELWQGFENLLNAKKVKDGDPD